MASCPSSFANLYRDRQLVRREAFQRGESAAALGAEVSGL